MTDEKDDLSTNVIAFPNATDEDYVLEFQPDKARLNIVIEVQRLEHEMSSGAVGQKDGNTLRALNQWSLECLESAPDAWVDWIYRQMANIQDSSEYVEIDFDEE